MTSWPKMNKKQLIITLVILLYFPVFAHAGIIYLQVLHNDKRGEFASLVGIFNSNFNIAPYGEFTTRGLFTGEPISEDKYSGEFKGPTGIFNQSSNELRGPASTFKAPRGEFSSAGSISRTEQSIIANESFKSPDQGEFKFSLPK